MIILNNKRVLVKFTPFFRLNLYLGLFVALSACGGGGGGGGGGTTSATNSTGTVGTSINAPTGESLYISHISYSLNPLSLTTSSLLNFNNLTSMSLTTVNSPSSGYYSRMISDSSGNIYAVVDQISGGNIQSVSVVKFPNAINTATSLTPTTIISSLPANIEVRNIALDGSRNLYLTEVANNSDTLGNIVEYTATSSYTNSSTYFAFSKTGGNSGPCGEKAYLAFDSAGQAWIDDVYWDGSACHNTLGIFNGTTMTNLLTQPEDNSGPIVFDGNGHLWELAEPCLNNCTTNSNGGVFEFTSLSTGSSANLVASFPSGEINSGENAPIQPVFDEKGNLWFALVNGNLTSTSCNNGMDLEELPNNQTSLTTAYSYSSCNSIQALAVIPVPTGLPLN